MSIDNRKEEQALLKAPEIRFSAPVTTTYRENGAETEVGLAPARAAETIA